MECRLLVHGDRACFRRPEFAEDLISYDVITPLAARGIFEAIHSAPGAGWRIDEIRVLRPIRATWMTLAEVDCGVTVAGIVGGRRDRRMAQVLSDTAYEITAQTDEPGDPAALRERIASGRFVRPPCLGHRSFTAGITLLGTDDSPPTTALAGTGSIDLGWMLHDYEAGGGPRFFRPTMIDGVIDLRRRESLILAG